MDYCKAAGETAIVRYQGKDVELNWVASKRSFGEDIVWIPLTLPGIPSVKVKSLAAVQKTERVALLDSVNHQFSSGMILTLAPGEAKYTCSSRDGSCGALVVTETKVVGVHYADKRFYPFMEGDIDFFRNV